MTTPSNKNIIRRIITAIGDNLDVICMALIIIIFYLFFQMYSLTSQRLDNCIIRINEINEHMAELHSKEMGETHK